MGQALWRRAYGFSRSVVAEVLEKILLTRQFEVEEAEALARELEGGRRALRSLAPEGPWES